MSPAARHRPLLLALAGVTLLAGSAAVSDRIRVAEDRPYDLGFIPSASALRWLSLGHPTLAANALWLRTVQYMGEPRAEQRGWEKLRPVVEVITDLDPRHGYAYQTSANILASVGRVDESNAILEKGTRNVPNRYIIPFQRAVNAFLYAGDYAEAGRWFERAAATPGAPARLREYVIAMYVKADYAEAALGFLQRLDEEAQDDESRRAIAFQRKRALLERAATAIERAALAWRSDRGMLPLSPMSLVVDGYLRTLPEDPFGGQFYFDEEGRVRSTAFGQRFARPDAGPDRERAGREARARLERTGEGIR